MPIRMKLLFIKMETILQVRVSFGEMRLKATGALCAGQKVSYIFIDLENFRFINMKGDIEEGARLVNLLSDLIHEEFPDALIIRGASIQFIVLTGVDDVTKRLQYIHNEAKEVRPEYNIIVKAGVYVAKDEHILPITACDYAKAACANIKSDVHSIYQIYDDELNQSLTIRNYVISHLTWR